MNEGEDPETPIIPDDNQSADNSDGVFSIRHDEDPADEPAAEPMDVSDQQDIADDVPVGDNSAPVSNFDNDAEPRDIFGGDEPAAAPEPEPTPIPAPETTPVTPVNNMNVSQNKPERASYSQRRSGGRRDFSNNAAQTPDFFSNAMAANATAVAMNNERSSGKKKFILIGAIGGLAVVLIAVLAFVVMSMPKSVSAKDTLTKFNAFANYLINGSDSAVTLTGQYSETEHYHVEDFYPGNESISDEEYTTFATKANEFVDVAKGAQVSDDLKNELITYANNIYAWSLYSSFSIDSKELVNVYEKNGEGRANKFIDDKYSKLSKMDDMEATKNALVDSMKLQLEYTKLIEVDGCKVSELSDECWQKVYQIDNTNDLPGRLNQRLDEAAQLAGQKRRESIKKSWDISNKLSEEVK